MPVDGTFTTSLIDPLLYHHGSVRLNLNNQLNYLNIFFNSAVAFLLLWSVKCLLTWAYKGNTTTVKNKIINNGNYKIDHKKRPRFNFFRNSTS